ncbi:hypothetical protein BDW75DRAFT_206511 [Aspergillus navahoensis]
MAGRHRRHSLGLGLHIQLRARLERRNPQHAKPPSNNLLGLSFNPGQPEVQADWPFAKLVAPYGKFRTGSPESKSINGSQIGRIDIVLQKTRWYATAWNTLEQILRARGIKSVAVVFEE